MSRLTTTADAVEVGHETIAQCNGFRQLRRVLQVVHADMHRANFRVSEQQICIERETCLIGQGRSDDVAIEMTVDCTTAKYPGLVFVNQTDEVVGDLHEVVGLRQVDGGLNQAN